MKKGLFYTLVVALVLVFGASAFYLGNYFLEGKKSEARYNELKAIVAAAKNESAETAAVNIDKSDIPEEVVAAAKPMTYAIEDVNEDGILKCYAELHQQNPDMMGWIKIEGTQVDYPVMQSAITNANFYLDHDFDKNASGRGSIYAREECDLATPGDNVTLYGHHMKDGSMFAGLSAYTSKEKWDENNLIFFDTLYDYHVYKIFAVFKTTANLGEGFTYQLFENAQTPEEFAKFVSTCKQMSFYDTGITPVYGDKLICLSTCEYTLDNGRLIVAAVRIT